jgi:hypothetical protein
MKERQDGNTLTTEDDFDIELEAAQERGPKRPKIPRKERNEQYGFGGSKRKIEKNNDDVHDLLSFNKKGQGRFHIFSRLIHRHMEMKMLPPCLV